MKCLDYSVMVRKIAWQKNWKLIQISNKMGHLIYLISNSKTYLQSWKADQTY